MNASDRSPLQSRSFRALLAATVATFTGYGVLLPVVALWAVHGGASTAQAGTTTGVLMATTVASQLGVPVLMRRFGYRTVLITGAAILGVCGIVFAGSDQLAAVLIVAAVRGVGFGLLTVAGSAMVAELLPVRLRGRGTGNYGMAVGIPQLFGMPAGVWLVDHVGFTTVFVAAGLASLLGAVLGAGIRRVDLHQPAATSISATPTVPDPSQAKPVLRTHVVLLGLAGPFTMMLVGAIGTGALQTFAPLALATPAAAPMVLFVVSGAMSAGRWVAGVVGDRSGRPTLLIPGVVGAAIGMGGLALASQPGSSAADSGVLGALGALLLGLGAGALQNHTLVLMFGRVRREHYGIASMAWNVSLDAGTGLGSVLLGVMASGLSFAWAFALLAAVMVATAPLAARTRREGARIEVGDDRTTTG